MDDVHVIETLIYRYAEYLDSGQLEALAELFARASVRTHGRPAVRRGRDEVLAMYRSTVQLYDGVPATKHVTTNVMVAVDTGSGTAAARSYFTVLQARPELPLQIVIAGRYRDQFARDTSGWYFTERVIFVDLMGDLRFHLQRPISDR